MKNRKPITAVATVPAEFSALTSEDVAINKALAKRIPGFWGMLDHNGTARVADRCAFARQTTLVRVKCHDERFHHHSHLATDFVAGEALDNRDDLS